MYEAAFKSSLHEWSRQLSLASPESDFTVGDMSVSEGRSDPTIEKQTFSGELSFSSPEADFVAQGLPSRVGSPLEWSGGFSYASPESDFTSANNGNSTRSREPEWSVSLSFATPSSDFIGENATQSNTISPNTEIPLPKSIAQAMDDKRAVVVTSTEAPFRIVDVNEVWEGLCGYTREEAKNQEVGLLLQGPETDSNASRSLMVRLAREEYAETVLTNYDKSGRPFKNLLRVSTLPDENGEPEYLIGVLHEIPASERLTLSQS